MDSWGMRRLFWLSLLRRYGWVIMRRRNHIGDPNDIGGFDSRSPHYAF